MLSETGHYGIPATLRGMVNNDLKTTAESVLSLVKDGATDGVQIDPTLFHSTASAACGPGSVLQPGARHHPGKPACQAGAGESGRHGGLPAGGSGTAGRHRG
ncbi:TrbC family F-type conjugative pilus assembly protein [Escherichia coli]